MASKKSLVLHTVALLFTQLRAGFALPSGETEALSKQSAQLGARHGLDPASPVLVASQALAFRDLPSLADVAPDANSTSTPVQVVHLMNLGEPQPREKTVINYDCGFTLNDTLPDKSYALFTDMIETDWVHISDVEEDTDWKPTTWNLSCNTHSMVENIRENPLSGDGWQGQGQHWGRAGLQLIAPKPENKSHGITPQAYMRTKQANILYGTFRTAAHIPNVPGTFATFNWRAANNADLAQQLLMGYQFPSGDSKSAKIWAGNIENFEVCSEQQTLISDSYFQLAEVISDRLHEFRFDWLPGRIDFFIDNHWVWSSTNGVPDTAGALEYSIWSNFDKRLGEVHQDQQAVFTIAYSKAYFNTTDHDSSDVAKAWADQSCQGGDLGRKTLTLPAELGPGQYPAENGRSMFISKQETWEDDMAEENGGQRVQLSTLGSTTVAMSMLIIALLL